MLSDNVVVKLNPRVLFYNRLAFVLCFIDLLRDLEDGAELMDETRENNVNEARQPSYVPSTDDFTLIEIRLLLRIQASNPKRLGLYAREARSRETSQPLKVV